MKTKTNKKPEILQVQILEAKPNKMFTESQRQGVRFLRYSRPVPCEECGRKLKIMWTMLYEFRCTDMTGFMLKTSDRVHPPLTPVCGDHPTEPAFPKEKTE